MINKNIKEDQRLLESIVNKYGKEDVITYVKKLNESDRRIIYKTTYVEDSEDGMALFSK